MRRLSLTAVIVASTIAFAQMASAAPPSPPADGWAGWYAGLNVGGAWGGNPVSTTASNSEYCSACGHALETANASIEGATGEFPVNADGFIGGIQFGYNWQLANRWIAGFEADLEGFAGANGSNTTSSSASVSGFAGHAVATDLSVTKSIDFLGTVRGRLGYLVKPRLLVFGTGGFAYGHVSARTNISQHLIGTFGGVATSFGADLSVYKMLAGWTVGGGFEWMFVPNWTVKVEYLYYDLGVTSGGLIADPITVPSPPTTYYFVNNVQSSTRFNGNIVRFGLSYHF